MLETGSQGIFGLIRKKAHIRVKIQEVEEETVEPGPEKKAAPQNKKAKKKMTQEQHIIEADDKQKGPSETERAQKQIAQQKKLNKQKEVQKKAQDAKGKMQN